jgi:hypothetical protein
MTCQTSGAPVRAQPQAVAQQFAGPCRRRCSEEHLHLGRVAEPAVQDRKGGGGVVALEHVVNDERPEPHVRGEELPQRRLVAFDDRA